MHASRRLRLLVASAALASPVAPSVATASSIPPGPGYTLLFADEFEGDRVDESVWVYRSDHRTGAAGPLVMDGLNRKENIRVAHGHLLVRLDREVIDDRLENTGGGLITKKRFGYGYYEARLRPFMAGDGGVHTAFWQRGVTAPVLRGQLLDPSEPRENVIFEIDSTEIDNPLWEGTNNLYDVIATRAMGDGYPWPIRFHVPIEPLEGGWLIDAYEYTPEGVTFYDNHRVVARTRYDRVRGQQNVWLTALNGFGPIHDPSVFPGEAAFDYFRYYAKDYPGANLLGNESFDYNLDRVSPQDPIAWLETGDTDASLVVEGDAAIGAAKLRHASDRAYRVTTSQTLHHILNGSYAASALVRSSGGQRLARLVVRDHGGEPVTAVITASAEWTRVLLPHIEVTAHQATVAFESDADTGQWLEVDDVQFLKPAAPDQLVVESRPFEALTDPIWRALDDPMSLRDGTGCYFDRSVGLGKAITIAFRMQPDRRADQVVLERMPREGDSGWSVRLTRAGQLVFRIGSVANHTDLVATDAYAASTATHVACVFDRGTARLYLDGREVAMKRDIPHRTEDRTAIGTLVDKHRASPGLPYAGVLQGLRVHNRALTAAEIATLAAP